jgi:hypothetical protein
MHEAVDRHWSRPAHGHGSLFGEVLSTWNLEQSPNVVALTFIHGLWGTGRMHEMHIAVPGGCFKPNLDVRGDFG